MAPVVIVVEINLLYCPGYQSSRGRSERLFVSILPKWFLECDRTEIERLEGLQMLRFIQLMQQLRRPSSESTALGFYHIIGYG